MSTASRLASFDQHRLAAGHAPTRHGLTADTEERATTRPARLPALPDNSPTEDGKRREAETQVPATTPNAPEGHGSSSPPPRPTPKLTPRAAVDAPTAAAPAALQAARPDIEAEPETLSGHVRGSSPTAEQRDADEQSLAALAASIHRIGQDMERFRESAERRAAEGFGAAAAQCLPHLATEGFAGEVTAAVLNVARELRAETATLLLPPADLHAVAGALKARNPEIAFTLAGDPSLPPGTARISWPKGGAALSAERLAEAAMDIFHRHIGRAAPAPGQGAPDAAEEARPGSNTASNTASNTETSPR